MVEIPGPKKLKEEIDKDDQIKTETAKKFAESLLESAGIANILLQNRRALYSERSKLIKIIKTTPADLAKEKLEIDDLVEPIKEILKEYTVETEPNLRDSSISLTISIPENFFNGDTENK